MSPDKPKILILGGCGVFGKKIAETLKVFELEIIIAGRNLEAARNFANKIQAKAASVDIHHNLANALKEVKPFIVVNCCGPFQEQDYSIAKTCIEHGYHYIDLADSREYVANFHSLNNLAEKHGVIAITGASTVPAISSAVIDRFLQDDFSEINSINYGVTPGNQTERGNATVAAILTYVGKKFKTPYQGEEKIIYGWQDLHLKNYAGLGNRWMGNCDIPDLTLFLERYPSIKTIRFFAGLELSILHLGLWLLSWPVRWNIINEYTKHANFLRKISLWFYSFGTSSGGMHMKANGMDKQGHHFRKSWYLIAEQGDGPFIPAAPAAILVQKIINLTVQKTGAFVCMGFFTMEDLMDILKGRSIKEVIQ